jgi:hypothetical protein
MKVVRWEIAPAAAAVAAETAAVELLPLQIFSSAQFKVQGSLDYL